jgi:hypothetical protein
LSRVKSFIHWIGESEDLDRLGRLVTLGLAEDKPDPLHWLPQLLAEDPVWQTDPHHNSHSRVAKCINRKNGDALYINIAYSTRLPDNDADAVPVWVRIDLYAKSLPHNERSEFRVDPGLSNFEIARQIVDFIKEKY